MTRSGRRAEELCRKQVGQRGLRMAVALGWLILGWLVLGWYWGGWYWGAWMQSIFLFLLLTEAKRNQILELLESIEERLNDLEEEKEELKEYQKWDKMHRSLEYTIHEKELRETRGKIDNLTDQHDNASQKSRELHKKVTEAQAKIEVSPQSTVWGRGCEGGAWL